MKSKTSALVLALTLIVIALTATVVAYSNTHILPTSVEENENNIETEGTDEHVEECNWTEDCETYHEDEDEYCHEENETYTEDEYCHEDEEWCEDCETYHDSEECNEYHGHGRHRNGCHG